jgi:hypothetical protein
VLNNKREKLKIKLKRCMIENLEVQILSLSIRKYSTCHYSIALRFKAYVHLLHLKTNCQKNEKEKKGLLSSTFDEKINYFNKNCQMLIMGMIFKQINKISMVMAHMSLHMPKNQLKVNYL